ncbi:MAG: nucleoside deaminase [Oscillospiraceae bacterium]|jgi:tRNA(adenine34) deaminase|nr:nucleoside deaminase [Oscillospiraceae bacterium]
MNPDLDAEYMSLALALAEEAAESGEVPIGCVIIDDTGEVIGAGRNRRESARNALAHAEIEAIDMACRARGSWRLQGCTAYVTLEPCPMCLGAFRAARISRVFFGADNINPNAAGQEPVLQGGVLGQRCRDILSRFFKSRRQ